MNSTMVDIIIHQHTYSKEIVSYSYLYRIETHQIPRFQVPIAFSIFTTTPHNHLQPSINRKLSFVLTYISLVLSIWSSKYFIHFKLKVILLFRYIIFTIHLDVHYVCIYREVMYLEKSELLIVQNGESISNEKKINHKVLYLIKNITLLQVSI